MKQESAMEHQHQDDMMIDHFQMQRHAAMNPVQIPSCTADWFDIEEIHHIERE